jgi:hypothetical protein
MINKLKKIKLISLSIAFAMLVTTGNSLVLAYSQNDLFSVLKGTAYYDGSDSCDGAPSSPSATSQGIGSGDNVYILGDSITAISDNSYKTAFSTKSVTADIDGSSGRSINGPGIDGNKLNGMDAITADKTEITSANAIVVALGTNGGNTTQSIDGLISALRADNKNAPIYWVDTIVVNRPSYSPTIQAANTAIYSQATADNYTVISWFKTVDPTGNPQALSGSETDTNNYIRPMSDSGSLGVHPTVNGIDALTKLVSSAVFSGTGGNTATTNSGASCCNSSSSGDSTLVGSDNIQKAYNYFVSKGFTPAQSAGVVGNLNLESGVEPEKLEGGQIIAYESLTPAQKSNSSLGWGIAQFTPPSSFGDSIKDSTKDPNSLEVQLDFIWNYLQGNDIKQSGKTYAQAIQATSTTDDAATVFMNDYERPLIDSTHDGGLPARKAYAKQILEQYGGGTTSGSISSSSSSCGSSSPGTYKNPFRDVKNIYGNRADQGVDYDGDGNVYAIGNGKIHQIYQNWYLAEPFMSYELTDGPAQGKIVYVAECITISPGMTVGTSVTPDTVIAVMNNTACRNGIESGWGQNNMTARAMAAGCWNEPFISVYGLNFSNLIKSLGGPSANNINSPTDCTLEPGWPTF